VVESSGGQVLVHYEGYDKKYDEWISCSSSRIEQNFNEAVDTIYEKLLPRSSHNLYLDYKTLMSAFKLRHHNPPRKCWEDANPGTCWWPSRKEGDGSAWTKSTVMGEYGYLWKRVVWDTVNKIEDNYVNNKGFNDLIKSIKNISGGLDPAFKYVDEGDMSENRFD
jgi:hypothetical protein